MNVGRRDGSSAVNSTITHHLLLTLTTPEMGTALGPLRAAVRLSRDTVCARCLVRLERQSTSQLLSRSSRRKLHAAVAPQKLVTPQTFEHDYFSANTSIDRGWVKNGVLATLRSIAESPSSTGRDAPGNEIEEPAAKVGAVNIQREIPKTQHQPLAVLDPPRELPHRRRKRLKEEAAAREQFLPENSSSQLTSTAANLPSSASLRRTVATYLSLSKPRLSFLILLTTTSAYGLFPVPEILSEASSLAPTSLSTSTLTLAYLSAGTFLSCACANALNMLFEPKYDALMARTRNRPLVRKLVSIRSAYGFAIACGMSGLALLYLGTNPTVAGLSALNIFLYAGVYTPMKRISAVNTWVGALVGGIPPLMGWAAAAGQVATSEHHSWTDLLFSGEAIGGWLMAALLFAWQFPHFNSLSHQIRDDYKKAGHKMLCWTNPARNGRVAVRYSLMMFPVCAGLWWTGYVNGGFMVVSTACNIWMTREAVKFWKRGGAGGSARGLFWASVWQLPLVLIGALVFKKGIWQGIWDDGLAAATEEDEEDSGYSQYEQPQGLMDVELAPKLARP